MHSKPRQMHIGVFVIGAGNHISGWQMPGAVTSSENFPAILEVARTAEQAKLDFVFFADAPSTALDGHPGYLLQFEPLTLLAALAANTSHIGLVATASTTFMEPYNLARFMASLDKLSGGRVGWNVVTTAQQSAADNFGKAIPSHAARYEMAAEYLDVVQGLWDSWEADPLILDKRTGTYFDRSKVHTLNHDGKFFKVKGPLGVSRSPQGQPVIVQAGSSPDGQRFASRYAEVIFTIQQDIDDARAFYKGLKDRAVELGRSADDIKILPGLFPIVGRTEAEARAKYDELVGYIKPGSALLTMSERYGHDMSKFPMDGPVPDLPVTEQVQSFLTVLYKKARKENLKLRDIHDLMALCRGYILVNGTPKTIVDTMEEWFATKACDGFMITPAIFPASLHEFNELVVPELQRRGLFRTDYEGATLRSHFGLSEPPNRYTAARQAPAGARTGTGD